MKPSTTFTVFIHPPDFGALFSSEGKRAKTVKGMANAMAKPSIPIVGAMMSPWVDTATNRKPMMGPVQENDTRVSVKAIRKIDSSPVADSDFWSILFDQLEGSVSSKAPKNDAANTISSAAKKILKMAFVDRAFSADAPNKRVTKSPNNTYMTIIEIP